MTPRGWLQMRRMSLALAARFAAAAAQRSSRRHSPRYLTGVSPPKRSQVHLCRTSHDRKLVSRDNCLTCSKWIGQNQSPFPFAVLQKLPFQWDFHGSTGRKTRGVEPPARRLTRGFGSKEPQVTTWSSAVTAAKAA